MTKASKTRVAKRRNALQIELRSNPIRTMSYNRDAVKQPFRSLPVTDDMCAWLGKIAVTWAAIEIRLNELIIALAEGIEVPENWKRRSFKSRKNLCKDLVKERFSKCPNIQNLVADTLGGASQAHWKRNLLLHGEIETTLEVTSDADFLKMTPPTIDARITARGVHNGQPLTLMLWTADVESIFYDVGHAYGRISQITDARYDFPEIASQERPVWQGFLAKGLRPIPSARTAQPPPQS